MHYFHRICRKFLFQLWLSLKKKTFFLSFVTRRLGSPVGLLFYPHKTPNMKNISSQVLPVLTKSDSGFHGVGARGYHTKCWRAIGKAGGLLGGRRLCSQRQAVTSSGPCDSLVCFVHVRTANNAHWMSGWFPKTCPGATHSQVLFDRFSVSGSGNFLRTSPRGGGSWPAVKSWTVGVQGVQRWEALGGGGMNPLPIQEGGVGPPIFFSVLGRQKKTGYQTKIDQNP